MRSVAIYPGSFDPPTLGHVDVICRGAVLFDEVIVAIGHNPAKSGWLPVEQRKALLEELTSKYANVRVTTFHGLLVDACRQLRVTVILRGLRALSDFDLEFRNGLANRDISGFETLFMLTDPQHIFVSSSLVRELVQHGGKVDRYVPEIVNAAILAKQ